MAHEKRHRPPAVTPGEPATRKIIDSWEPRSTPASLTKLRSTLRFLFSVAANREHAGSSARGKQFQFDRLRLAQIVLGLPLVLVGMIGLAVGVTPVARAADSIGAIPLNDLGGGTYKGFTGGLYPSGSNAIPAAHLTAGMQRRSEIRRLNAAGQPSATGKIAFISVGISNTSQEFCATLGTTKCKSWTFMGQAARDPQVNHNSLRLVNGAQGGADALTWEASTAQNYARLQTRLLDSSLTERQVQVAWVKLANSQAAPYLPDPNADAYVLERRLGNVLRAMKVRYPNLKQVFLSSRTYGGYSGTGPKGDPKAYEMGFAVKWLVKAQIDQINNGGTQVDPRAGNLNYNSGAAPWIAWGPYLWADGINPRSDGLTWQRSDFQDDGIHPSASGETKVANMLMTFFKTSQLTSSWFLSDGAPAPTDTVGPQTNLTAPTSGATVSGSVTVRLNATDSSGIVNVYLLVDGVVVATDSTSPHSFVWDSRQFSNGSHSLKVWAEDGAGNIGQAGVTVTVSN